MPVRARLHRPILWSALSAVLVVTTLAGSQTAQQRTTPKDVFAHRANELTLAGLRPGRDSIKKAKLQYDGYWTADQPAEVNSIRITVAAKGRYSELRLTARGQSNKSC